MLGLYPWPMIQTCLQAIRENVLAQNELYYLQLPRYAGRITDGLTIYRRNGLQWLTIFLTTLGFFMMARARQWAAFSFLAVTYLYFVFMVGLGMWQGSRLFYPAQIAWSIAIGVVLGKIGSYMVRRIHPRPAAKPDPDINMQT